MAGTSSALRAHKRPLIAEVLGTALLVFFGAGAATLTFGINRSTDVPSGVVQVSLAFGLVLLVLVYALGPISGCHLNPAVTAAVLCAKRISLEQAVVYWLAQFAGGIVGAAALYGIFRQAPLYSESANGLGTNGYGSHSLVGLKPGGVFALELILTFAFVLVVLAVTRPGIDLPVAGLVIGSALMLVNVVGIPLDGASVNPARSLGPAVFVGGAALKQVWIFLVAPILAGVIGGWVYTALYAERKSRHAAGPALT